MNVRFQEVTVGVPFPTSSIRVLAPDELLFEEVVAHRQDLNPCARRGSV
jgi:hypothetical protein